MKTYIQKGACRVSNIACVYMLVDPFIGLPFYIGIGKRTRSSHHFREASKGRKSHKANKIRKLRRMGISDSDMAYYIATDLSANLARITEEELIKLFKSFSTLTNLSPGGERNPMEEPKTAKKHYASMKLWWAEKGERHSNRMKELWSNPNYKEPIAKAVSNAWNDPEFRTRRSAEISIMMKEIMSRPSVKAKHASAWNRPGVREKHAASLRAMWNRRRSR